VKTITVEELKELLKKTGRTQFISLTTITTPNMRKRGNPFPNARKLSLCVGAINWRYSRSVNRQRIREDKTPDFIAKTRQWGRKLKRNPLVSLRKKKQGMSYYLDLKLERRTELFFDSETRRKITKDELLPWLISPSPQRRQGLFKEVILRDFSLTNIAEISVNGEQYRIAPAIDEVQLYIPAPRAAGRKSAGRATPSQTASASPRASNSRKTNP
jgi:hypothetical protein